MSRINAKGLLILMAAALALSGPAAAGEEDILRTEQLAPEQVNYKTTGVELGSFEKLTNTTASEYYPLTYSIRYDNSSAKFLEYTVTRGTEVKKGDVLARFVITGSEAQLTTMKLNLQRLEEATADGIREREEAVAEARAALAAEKDGYEKEKKQLALRRKEIELEQYRYRQSYSIERQKEALNEELQRREENVLLAPVDGVITDVKLKKVDDAVSPNESLLTIASHDVLLLRVDNSSGGLRYNMKVDVVSGNNTQRTELTGRVVAADDSIPEKARGGVAYIQLDPYDPELVLRSLKVTAPTLRLDNVLIAKRTAVTAENGKYYVTKLSDGMVQKRYIDVGMLNMNEVWFLAGVSEGETLVID